MVHELSEDESQADVIQNIYDPIVIRLAVDLNLVDIALAHGGPITLGVLAEKSGAEPALLRT
jgi:hypothetical protein